MRDGGGGGEGGGAVAVVRRPLVLCDAVMCDCRHRVPVTREAARLYSTFFFFLLSFLRWGRLEPPSPAETSPMRPRIPAGHSSPSGGRGPRVPANICLSLWTPPSMDSNMRIPPLTSVLFVSRMEGIFDFALEQPGITALNAIVGPFFYYFYCNFVSLRLNIKGEILLPSSPAKGFAVLWRRVN